MNNKLFARSVRAFALACGSSLVLALAACGGGSDSTPASTTTTSTPVTTGTATTTTTTPVTTTTPATTATPTAANQVAVLVDSGTDGSAFNSPFVTVTVCLPGTSTCRTVDHVLVDSGSFGLRLAASALGDAFALPAIAAPSGGALAECAPFASGYAWGSVRSADVQIGGEKASGLPVQVVNDAGSAYAHVPTACSGTTANFGVGAGSKGILGLGNRAQDCGTGCSASPSSGVYFVCDAAANCAGSTAPITSQVTNPVAAFATDNNGVVLTLPSVPVAGAVKPTGVLTFGIGTQTNNQLGSATVITTDTQGDFTATYKGTRYTGFLDSGSNALFFPDSTIAKCSGGFYCPAQPLAIQATITSTSNVSTTVDFTLQNVQALGADITAAPIGGDTTSLGGRTFDFGLPFFFGRSVFIGMSTSARGPFIAF